MLQVALAQPIAWWLGDSRLIPMSVLLALPLPLVGAAGPVQGLLTRNRAYKALAGRTLIGQGLGTITGIAAAFAGAGAWALVLQQLVVSSAGALALLVRCPSRPRFIIRRQDLRDMLRIGLPLTASTLIQHGRYRLFALLIGGTAGAAALGQVHMAFRLVDTVRDLAFTAQWRLMLPLLSERQDDLPGLRAVLDRCLAWSSLLAFPLCGVMALSIQPLVQMLLGPVWQPSGAAALPLIALTAWLFLAFPAGVAVIARGVPRYALIGNIAALAATVVGVMLIRPASPMHAMLVWLGAQLFISPYLLHANARVLRTRPLRPLRAGLPMLAATVLATIAAFALPHAIGEPGSPAALLALRLLIAVVRRRAQRPAAGGCTGRIVRQGTHRHRASAMIPIRFQHLDAEPAPIDAVATDQSVLDLHRFDEVHLLAVGRLARVLPDQLPAIGEEPGAMAAPAWRGPLEHDAHKVAQPVAPFDDAAFRAQQMAHQRTLEPRVLCVERHGRLDVPGAQRRIPKLGRRAPPSGSRPDAHRQLRGLHGLASPPPGQCCRSGTAGAPAVRPPPRKPPPRKPCCQTATDSVVSAAIAPWTGNARRWQTPFRPVPIHEARMPTYDYDCERCGPFSESHPMAEFALPQACPACGDAAPRALTSPAIGGGRAEPAAATPFRSHPGGCACCAAPRRFTAEAV